MRKILGSGVSARRAARGFSASGQDAVSASLKGLSEGLTGFKNMNQTVEFDKSLTSEQKAQMKQFLVYRSNPSDPNDDPKLVSYWIDLKKCAPMYLDALIKIKDDADPTLAFRRSCREGVCGSCSMNVNGKHQLACITEIDTDLSKPAVITPLGHMFVMRDLVVDMTNFYAQYKEIQPFLQRKTPKENGQKEYYQSEADRQKLDGLYECVLCASCSTSCPSYWWSQDKYLGPATLMQAYRWIVDSRDEYTDERLEHLSKDIKMEGCEEIGMCTATCPKNLDPKKAMQELRQLIRDYQVRKHAPQTN